MARCLAIDPGNKESAFVLFDGQRILDHGHWGNVALLNRLRERRFGEDYITVIEQMEGFGMQVGSEVLRTVWWAGRFYQASRPAEEVTRKAVKRHLCGKTNVNDKAVREALVQRFGGFPAGFASHRYAALAVAVTWMDQQQVKAGAA